MAAKKSYRIQMRVEPGFKKKVHDYCKAQFGELSRWNEFTWCVEKIAEEWFKKIDNEKLLENT